MAYDKLSLNGKVAVVVGGTTGIGNALSLGLTEAGASVVATSRRIEEVERTAAQIEQRGGRTLRQTSDVTDRASLEKLKDVVLARFEKVDILINCAGRTKRTPTLDVSEEEWNAIVECNLTGTLRGCQIFGRHMLERGYGRIVNIASLTTFLGFKDVAAYGASKAAVGSLTKTLAVEWGPRGVNVNGIAPGVFLTDLNRQLLEGSERGKELKLRTPGGRFGHVDELVGAAIFLSSDAAGFVNGEIIAVDGGFLASGVNQ
jgi:NAD(P)-dependent dehydrogenase (short-subunit alcohol dehydrogenase family)